MWLLAAAVRQAMEDAWSNGILPSAEDQANYEARYGFSEGDTSRVLSVSGKVARISASGVMTPRPSFMAMLFGGGNVTYSELNAALAAADKDPEVERAEMAIDSPGGSIDGLFETIAAMQAFSKPLKATVTNTAASAAFALASQADEVVASNKAARVGSVGVVASFAVNDSRVDVASTNAPRKRPDVTTEAGQAIVREEIDALHELFVDAIATGRGITPEKVNAEFGQGGMILADEAVKRGMIDAVADAPLRVVKNTTKQTTALSGGNKPENRPMDRQTLKAEHPDVYAAVFKEGQDEERERVGAHLTMGEASGDMATAIAAINDGSGLTAGLQAKYYAAGMNRTDQQNRQDDDKSAAGADGAASADAEDAGDLVCSAVEQRLGIVEG